MKLILQSYEDFFFCDKKLILPDTGKLCIPDCLKVDACVSCRVPCNSWSLILLRI